MSGRFAIILAAGQGTRMKSKLYKVLHHVCGKPMVSHVVDQVQEVGFDETAVIVGHGAAQVKETLSQNVHFVLQNEQLGTGHAVRCAESLFVGRKGTTVVLCGDTPLLQADTIRKLIQTHEAREAKATVLTAIADDATGYGRIIRGTAGDVERIVEHKDANESERATKEINTGTYCFDNEVLFEALTRVTNENVQGEYYLPDVIGILQQQGEKIAAYRTDHFADTLGVNDRVALSEAEALMRARINARWMREGVTLIDPTTTYISVDANIGRDTTIAPGCVIKGTTVIGEGCRIESGTEIEEAHVGDNVCIRQSVVTKSQIASGVTIGPFAHIRPGSVIGCDAKVGNFVELKKTTLAERSKVSHLSYIGDANVGEDVNIGCGVVTVNYDGENKWETIIRAGAFVGSGTNLIAPVEIGKEAFVAAGSTITETVPDHALAIGRARQVNKENYVKKDR
ncbi:bifunctional UDP-N-acetylglucosamine diphosphorylase/glucosamine-1-phosphate N-acetyltransferase GlmU [Shouchella lonarensis]|uniref:Bifunctional protein GlmU n=1 Tax=Shouchella lonarensis TaxID=1464122 RepID=A0A1G6NZ12_9BACI|nr:bifunctional UDP-N-acetylglucosamine diphosphorylase/glucosamine-1-phosphate N-acetyltransferase GlmU [Shouchella lonarensis]SDC72891.1 UDP-N-acetylglucosamine pyrophosphorylase /glucosamine-1-phosphate N-acetyltransferase [Shouchella lonarensis]